MPPWNPRERTASKQYTERQMRQPITPPPQAPVPLRLAAAVGPGRAADARPGAAAAALRRPGHHHDDDGHYHDAFRSTNYLHELHPTREPEEGCGGSGPHP